MADEPVKTDPSEEREKQAAASRKETAAALDAISRRSLPTPKKETQKAGEKAGTSEGKKDATDTAVAATPSTTAPATPAATPTKDAVPTPASEPAPDLRHIPDEFRDAIKSLDPKVAAFVVERQRGYMRTADYSREKNALEAKEEALKKREFEAEFGATILSKPGVAKAAREAYDREVNGQPASDANEFEPEVAQKLDERIRSAIRKEVPTLVEEGTAKAFEDRFSRPMNALKQRQAAVLEFCAEQGIDRSVADKAIGRADDYNAKTSGPLWSTIAPDKVVDWLSPFLPAKGETNGAAKTHEPSQGPPAKSAGVATPGGGGGGGAVTPPPLPNHIRENRKADGRRERLEGLAYSMSLKRPDLPPVTAEQLEAQGL